GGESLRERVTPRGWVALGLLALSGLVLISPATRLPQSSDGPASARTFGHPEQQLDPRKAHEGAVAVEDPRLELERKALKGNVSAKERLKAELESERKRLEKLEAELQKAGPAPQSKQ